MRIIAILILFFLFFNIIFSYNVIGDNILKFLPIGTTINYYVHETSSNLNSYVTFDIYIKMQWNGTAFSLSGKSISHATPVTFGNGTTISNITGSYEYPLNLWIYVTGAGTPTGFLETSKSFTYYNGIPALELKDYNNYTYISLQYMIPLKAYFSENLNPATNQTFSSLLIMNNSELSFYTGSYNVYNATFNYAYQNYPVNLNLLVASKEASLELLNYSNKLSLSIVGSQFISILLPITTFNDLVGIGKFIYNGSTYYIILSSQGTSLYLNSSVPIVASLIPGTNYYMISVPYSGNLTLVFNGNYQPHVNSTIITPQLSVKTVNVGSSINFLYPIIAVILIGVVIYLNYRLRKK
ncbi:MAG: hypothetical protein QXY68_04395 [Saccharolobus sp.]